MQKISIVNMIAIVVLDGITYFEERVDQQCIVLLSVFIQVLIQR
jgi:hypothetical protein